MYSEEALAWFRLVYRYDPTTGVVTRNDTNEVCNSLHSTRMYYSEQPKRKSLGIRGNVLLHQLAWFLHHGEWPTREIDHVNLNGLDNRIENLRLASHAENMRNRRKPYRSDATSQFKGVGWRSDKQRWRARIVLNGKAKHLGYFDSEEQARNAYNEAAANLHGEFARTS